jgi:hypothetical protein
MSANERQVGGDHYKRAGTGGEEHWDRIWRMYGRGYFVGCITKYVERYHLKNGIQDLEKAAHFLQKLIELEGREPVSEGTPVQDTVIKSGLDVTLLPPGYEFYNGDPSKEEMALLGFQVEGWIGASRTEYRCNLCKFRERAKNFDEFLALHEVARPECAQTLAPSYPGRVATEGG